MICMHYPRFWNVHINGGRTFVVYEQSSPKTDSHGLLYLISVYCTQDMSLRPRWPIGYRKPSLQPLSVTNPITYFHFTRCQRRQPTCHDNHACRRPGHDSPTYISLSTPPWEVRACEVPGVAYTSAPRSEYLVVASALQHVELCHLIYLLSQSGRRAYTTCRQIKSNTRRLTSYHAIRLHN
jgi:hypothetical protein